MANPTLKAAPQPSEQVAAPSANRRLLSLDALRGLTIAFMIMVNDTGGPGAWKEMQHSPWNGMTATDLVFPGFLFMVGITTVFSVEARLARGATRAQLALHTVQRAVILFALGIVVNGFPYFHLAHLRIYGVLQRIAICYLVVGLLYLFDRRVWTKIALLVILLAGYWALVRWVPVPGAGVPGRDVPFLDRNQNIVAWVDRQLMPGHLYREWPNFNARDPEGLLSDIPAIGTTLIGLLAGLWLRSRRAISAKTLGLVGGAVACMAAGYFWSIWFPLNKKMWTSSYVLAAAGWTLALLAFTWWAVEQKGWGKTRSGKAVLWPWLVFGSNAIVAYMISELLTNAVNLIPVHATGTRAGLEHWIYFHAFLHIPNPGWRAFAFSVAYTAVCFVPVWVLYRKKIFVKI
ncbi:MAG TPA: heparan-alpha-glucosaminide N-acetyltransferase domain-containing protein [Terracidiphilus sp.]|nr:heparan-alpha-glucosaminide N-acetyltransferase domain-containing protein [Terracidiphilus sp.]